MIPKIIHCCWLSGAPKTQLARKCLVSWRKFAPGWEIREWTMADVGELTGYADRTHDFFRTAVAARKWAFAADVVRMLALSECGGVYFDFDFELVRPIAELPEGEWVAGQWLPNGVAGIEPAAIALEKDSPIARAMLDHYAKAEFSDKQTVGEILGSLDIWKRGAHINVLPPEVMSPIDVEGRMHRTEKTVGIHWCAMSWCSWQRRLARMLSWHGMRPLVDLALHMKRMVK